MVISPLLHLAWFYRYPYQVRLEEPVQVEIEAAATIWIGYWGCCGRSPKPPILERFETLKTTEADGQTARGLRSLSPVGGRARLGRDCQTVMAPPPAIIQGIDG